MTQIFFPPHLDDDSKQLYCYTNKTTKVVVAKVRGLAHRHCERVVFPEEKFLFEAHEDCELEIARQTTIGIVKDRIPCSQLQLEQASFLSK